MRLIDADKAYSILTDYYHHRTDIQHQALKEALNRVPTIYPPMGYKVLSDGSGWAYYGKEEAEPVRRGQWLTEYGDHIRAGLRPTFICCSECGMVSTVKWNYCPHCGARMEERE